MAGNGLIQGHMPYTLLSNNTIDIDSFLKGIRVTDLTDNSNKGLTPQLNVLPEYNLYCNQKTIMPEPFVPQLNQRPNLS
jgi:hypothetical protein